MKQGLYGFGLAAAIASLVFYLKTKAAKQQKEEKENGAENNKS